MKHYYLDYNIQHRIIELHSREDFGDGDYCDDTICAWDKHDYKTACETLIMFTSNEQHLNRRKEEND